MALEKRFGLICVAPYPLPSFTAMKSTSLLFLLALSCLQGFAQEYANEYQLDNLAEKKLAGYLSIRNDLNTSDYVLGAELGVINKKRNLSTFLTFDARPYRKAVLQYRGNNQFYQFREERYFLGVGAEYFHDLERLPLAAFVQANAAYTWGAYGGTEMKPENGLVLVPRLGLALDLKGYGWLKAGYTYLDTKTYRLDKHRLYIALSIFITSSP